MKTMEFMDKFFRNGESTAFELSEKIQSAENDPETMYEIAKKVGVTDSFEVFRTGMLRFLENAADELTEEELELVTGGRIAFANGEIIDDEQ